MRETRSPAPEGETTPLLEDALPPPAYPTTMEEASKSAASPTAKPQPESGFPSPKDIEEIGAVPVIAAVHLHPRPRRTWSRGKTLRLLLIACAHAVLIWLILTAAFGRRGHKHYVQPDPETPHLALPHLPYYCHDRQHGQTTTYDYDELDEFSVREFIQEDRHGHHDIRGTIKLVPAPEHQQPRIRANVTIFNNRLLEHEINTDKTDTGLEIWNNVSEASERGEQQRTCTVIEVVVSVLPDTRLGQLSIDSNRLSVEIGPSLDLTVDDFSIDLESGSVVSHTAIPGRRTIISPTYGSVIGIYSLMDLLQIETEAGSVDVEVKPAAADPANPQPAVFHAFSTAGTVSARFPTDDASLPDRDYRVAVKTKAGSVLGTYVHGSQSSFVSVQGSIAVKVLPFKPELASSIRTRNEVGPTMLDMLQPLASSSSEGFKNVTGVYTASVGSVRVVYPEEWEGDISVDTALGALRVYGHGIDVIRKGTHGPVGNWVEAVKGRGDSTVGIKSKTGSVEFLIEETKHHH